jgi:hypothetical protein
LSFFKFIIITQYSIFLFFHPPTNPFFIRETPPPPPHESLLYVFTYSIAPFQRRPEVGWKKLLLCVRMDSGYVSLFSPSTDDILPLFPPPPYNTDPTVDSLKRPMVHSTSVRLYKDSDRTTISKDIVDIPLTPLDLPSSVWLDHYYTASYLFPYLTRV